MRRARSVSLFAAFSLALHFAWLAWMPEGQRATRTETHWVEMSFAAPSPSAELQRSAADAPSQPPAPLALQVAAPPPSHVLAPRPAAQQLAAATSQRTEQQSRAAPARATRQPSEQPSQVELQPASEPAPTQQAEPQLKAAAPVAAASPVEPLALLPRSAALSFEALAQSAALRCAERAQGQSDCAPSQAEAGQTAQAALTRDLNAVASRIPHLREREHPALRRRSDGSYAYEGGVFQAVVRPDGKVEFRDTSIRSELRPSLVPFVVIADINDLVERDVLDRELYSAEKQWLLDETRELREKLATESRRRELLDANRALERTLRGILDDQALTLAQKHETLFLLWQDCGEDAEAQAHRRAVDSFVRRQMPQDSALGFRPEELDRLNTARAGLQHFEPYAGS